MTATALLPQTLTEKVVQYLLPLQSGRGVSGDVMSIGTSPTSLFVTMANGTAQDERSVMIDAFTPHYLAMFLDRVRTEAPRCELIVVDEHPEHALYAPVMEMEHGRFRMVACEDGELAWDAQKLLCPGGILMSPWAATNMPFHIATIEAWKLFTNDRTWTIDYQQALRDFDGGSSE